jgi:hypothetical protein
MAQTLSEPLAAAQLLTERKPLVEVTSDKFVPDIPFVGQRLSTDYNGLSERNPAALALSDGRLFALTTFSSGSYARFSISNVDRTEWDEYMIPASLTKPAVVEMPGGKVGILTAGVSYVYDLNTVPPALVASGSTGIAGEEFYISTSVNPEDRVGNRAVVRLANGNYMAVYVADDATYPAHGNITLKYSISSDFITWGAWTAIPLVNSEATHPKYNPFLFVTENGDVNLLFEYVEQYTGALGTTEKVNIYHYVSDDNGATWTYAPGSSTQSGPNGRTAGAITFYPDFGTTARHPYAISLGAGNWRISYVETASALHMNTTALGWEGLDSVVGMHFDEVARKTYVVNYNANDGGNLSSIVVVNPDTWQPIKSIWSGSTPTFSPFWFAGGSFELHDTTGARELTIIRRANSIGIYNSDTDQCTEFHFDAIPAYGVDANISPKAVGSTGGIGHSEGPMSIERMFLDYENRILYLYWATSYIWGGCYGIGKIDLTQTGPEYTHDVMWVKSSYPAPVVSISQAQMEAIGGAYADFHVFPGDNLIVFSGGWNSHIEGLGGPWLGVTMVYTMDGVLLKQFDDNNSDTYPYRGIQKFAKVGHDLYGIFYYEHNYDNAGRYGICKLDLTDFSVAYFRPEFATVEDYGFNSIIPIKDGDELLLTSDTYGAARFVIADASWVSYTNTTLPGLFPYSGSAEIAAYDTVNAGIFLGSINNAMLIYFYESGSFSQPQYGSAVFGGSVWDYGSFSPLTSIFREKQLVMTNDPASSGGMYAFWTHVNADGSTRIRWDKDLSEFDLTDYLVGGSSVTIKRSIDGSPNKLSFSVTHGHLFDPHNQDSLWSMILKKHRRITVRFGEDIGGTAYWVNAGTFVVVGGKMSYARGEYPTMNVEAEDIRIWWEDAEIVATNHYEMTPEDILQDVVSSWGGMDLADIVIPAMYGSYVIWFQWLDTTVKKVVDALCFRFGYFPSITADNKFTVRPISNANTVDHTYADGTKIISFSPDDDFSDFTNRVTVTGETRDFIDLLYEEESVGSLFGTAGWWGAKNTYDVWYSEDHKRKAKNPRLVIIESCIPNSFIQHLGGGSESIVLVDQDEFFCRVQVEVPDMSTIAWALGATLLVTGIAMGVSGQYSPSTGWGMFIGWVIGLSALMYILSGIVNYQYEIWARPYGQQRLGCEGQANDVELQALIGRIVEKKIDEPLAIDPGQCQWLADHELMIEMAQRNRVKFEKIAHLQDEEGDTLVVPHSYSGRSMTVFVTDLTRSFRIPTGAANDKGGFTDGIEGWKVAPV